MRRFLIWKVTFIGRFDAEAYSISMMDYRVRAVGWAKGDVRWFGIFS